MITSLILLHSQIHPRPEPAPARPFSQPTHVAPAPQSLSSAHPPPHPKSPSRESLAPDASLRPWARKPQAALHSTDTGKYIPPDSIPTQLNVRAESAASSPPAPA